MQTQTKWRIWTTRRRCRWPSRLWTCSSDSSRIPSCQAKSNSHKIDKKKTRRNRKWAKSKSVKIANISSATLTHQPLCLENSFIHFQATYIWRIDGTSKCMRSKARAPPSTRSPTRSRPISYGTTTTTPPPPSPPGRLPTGTTPMSSSGCGVGKKKKDECRSLECRAIWIYLHDNVDQSKYML